MRVRAVLVLVLYILSLFAFHGCAFPGFSLHLELALSESMTHYTEAVAGNIPENLRLKIYYTEPRAYCAPTKPEQWEKWDEPNIVVDSQELAAYLPLLQKLNASALQVQEFQNYEYIDAILYYKFEIDSDKILAVAFCKTSSGAYVNGIRVEDDPILFDLIYPFLTSEDIEIITSGGDFNTEDRSGHRGRELLVSTR